MDVPFALGYLDPGTGSVVLQIMVGGLLGGVLAVKMFWKRLAGFFAGRKTSPRQATPPADGGGTESPAP